MKLDKPLIAQLCGVGFTAFILKGLILILVYKEVVIMEPNPFILILEIVIAILFLIISFQGLIQTLKAKQPLETTQP